VTSLKFQQDFMLWAWEK